MEQKVRISKSVLQGEITIPPSKSHTLRAILFGALGKGISRVFNYLPSPDTEAMIRACQLLGAQMTVSAQEIVIQGTGGKITHAEDVIDAGNSGLVLRLCAAVGALAPHPVVITGDHSIRHQRPMRPLLQGLSQLGATATSMRGDGYAPVIIQGPLTTGSARIAGEDSQPVSALLIAGCFIEGGIELFVDNPGEKPWVGLTLDWFDRLQINYTHSGDFTHYRVCGGACYEGFDYTVPGDLSSAAFPIAAALITNSELLIKNVDLKDVQGDKEVIALFQRMGASFDIDTQRKTLFVRKRGQLSGIEADINLCIDGITILAVLACYAQGETHLYNAAIAKQKECNRIQSIATELRKMGAQITETEDGLRIQGGLLLQGAKLHSYHDHRMAMSLSVAGLGAEGETVVSPMSCVAKTFPSFLEDFRVLGARLL